MGGGKNQIKRMFIPVIGMACAVFLLIYWVLPQRRTILADESEKNLRKDVNTELLDAAQTGDIIKMAFCLGNGGEVNFRDPSSRTPLMFAAQNGYVDAAVVLLQANADCNATDSLGEHALSLAAGEGQLSVVQTLLRYGAKIDLGHENARTALLKACANGHNAVVEFLLDANAALWPGKSMNCGPLVMALSNKHADTALLLLERNLDHNELDAAGNNILQMAILCDSESLVKYIIEHCNIDPYSVNAAQENAFDIAERVGSDRIKVLLEQQR